MRRLTCVMAVLALDGCGSSGSNDAASGGSKSTDGVTMELPPVIPFHKPSETDTNTAAAAIPPVQAAPKQAPPKPTAIPAAVSAEAAKAPAPPPQPPKQEKPAPKPKAATTPKPDAPDAGTSTPAKASDDSAAASKDAALLPVRPPLSDAAIVRTIERIGFACGEVVSSGKVADAGGDPTYRVNCSSGESYRATNKKGRIFFRPWPGKSPKG